MGQANNICKNIQNFPWTANIVIPCRSLAWVMISLIASTSAISSYWLPSFKLCFLRSAFLRFLADLLMTVITRLRVTWWSHDDLRWCPCCPWEVGWCCSSYGTSIRKYITLFFINCICTIYKTKIFLSSLLLFFPLSLSLSLFPYLLWIAFSFSFLLWLHWVCWCIECTVPLVSQWISNDY